jgi:hypothetical protein
MFKKRIKKWDLDRNKKHADMLVALRLALAREAMGKKTSFSIRGRLVTFEDVKRYFRRKGIHDLKSFAFDASSFSPTTHIDCRTPEPETPIKRMGTENPELPTNAEEMTPHHDFSASNIETDWSVMAFPDPDQVDRKISITSTLGQVEQLLYHGWAYYDAIFADPAWRSNHNALDVGSLEKFYHLISDGQIFLEESNVEEAFIHFRYAFDLVRSLLNKQVLLFLPYIYRLLLPTRRIRRQEVISQLLHFIVEMIAIRYPQLHPIGQSLSLLGGMPLEHRGESTKRVYQCVLDRLKIQFEFDLPDVFEVDPNMLCSRARANLETDHNVDNYKLTSIAVWGLARDAEDVHDWGDVILYSPHISHLKCDTVYGINSSIHPTDMKPEDSLWSADFKIGDALLGIPSSVEWKPLLVSQYSQALRRPYTSINISLSIITIPQLDQTVIASGYDKTLSATSICERRTKRLERRIQTLAISISYSRFSNSKEGSLAYRCKA